jgi:hypothetical protein
MSQAIFDQLILFFLELHFAHYAYDGLGAVEERKSGQVVRMTLRRDV